MTDAPPSRSSINRTFRDLSDEEVADIEKASMLSRIGWAGAFGWDEVLRSERILIVSEAGVGKTYECQEQQKRLWANGEPAFFLDLATLALSTVREMLGSEEELRFDAWLRSQSDIATFFLDSFDELKLTLGKFDQALKRLNKALAGQLGRVKIVITTRPVPIDRELIVRHLPIPPKENAAPTAEAFADILMDRKRKASDNTGPKAWRNVGLMPLSREQMHAFATLQGVSDSNALLADIGQRDAEEFAERPQDLLELCSDWREHHRIRSHREQVETNIATKLKPSTERKERTDLSQETATEGASRLALAAMLTRKLTLRHSADVDSVLASEAALDVSKILQDWSAEAQSTLLERPLFGFASYGRVRFHHRSVVEVLAAKRLDALLERGVSIKSIKRLLFTESAQGTPTVRPSMRPVAAWLSLSQGTIFDDIVAIDPTIVLDHGDPQSLRPAQRIRALHAYVDRYGSGGRRGLRTPRIQVHRFASLELTDTVKSVWDQGIENPEVRHLLLNIIAAGKLTECSDIAYAAAMDRERPHRERDLAIDALLELNDSRLDLLSRTIATDSALWPNTLARQALLSLFPRYMPIERMLQILQRVKEEPRSVGDLTFRLPHEIEVTELLPDYLDQLRQGITDILLDGITWAQDKVPHLRTTRPDLIPSLIAACQRQATVNIRTAAWTTSSLLAIRLSDDHYSERNSLAGLRQALTELPADARESAFWQEDAFLAQLHQFRDSWHRVHNVSYQCGIQLSDEKDSAWVRKRLAQQDEPLEHREMMLWSEMLLLSHATTNPREHLESLRTLVLDAPSLTTIIDDRLKPQKNSAEIRKIRAANDKRTKQIERRTAKAHASWVSFWHEIAQEPDAAFAANRAEQTAWGLWQAVERSGHESRAAGWNRRFIEEQFGKEIADRLREIMKAVWRKDTPTLPSERPKGERNTFLVKWQFGLAGIAAEAENPNWARRITDQEAELACRYAPIELNGFPSWLESLAIEHPAAIDRVLGKELSLSLHELTSAEAYSIFLQNVSHASAIVSTLFIPRIRNWLLEIAQTDTERSRPRPEHNLHQAVEILVKNGNDDDRLFIEKTAQQYLADGVASDFADVWLPALLYLKPSAGVEALENRLKESAASKDGLGVQLFARLFNTDYGGIAVDLRAPDFTPSLLLKILRLAYQHVRVGDDAHHEGSYSPDTRDNAEKARNAILSTLFATTGPDGWSAKIEMANDPLFEHIKARTIALAEEVAAEEADNVAVSEAEFVALDKTGETPPKTREAMFMLMRDRLSDIDDLLLQDISPRELWASIGDEHVMRREIARALQVTASHTYTIDQEAVTADEKETDIRFRSTGSNQQGTIELKLGDQRSGNDLFNTLHDQLLTKYMAADDCRAGCLLVTIAREREWQHPKIGKMIDFEELIAVLDYEAQRLSLELGGTVKLMAKGLNLRPRLKKENTRYMPPAV